MLENTSQTSIDERCPVQVIAEVIGQKWTSLILRDLADGPRRFGELQHSLGVSPRVLSTRLHALEEELLVEKEIFAEVPPRTEYSLTEKGRLLIPIIDEMRRVGNLFKKSN